MTGRNRKNKEGEDALNGRKDSEQDTMLNKRIRDTVETSQSSRSKGGRGLRTEFKCKNVRGSSSSLW